MIDQKAFDDRVTALWESQKRMAAPRKWKSGRRAGMIRTAGDLIEFSKAELRQWLWEKVGLNAVQCRYCFGPIDILSLTLDHIIPRDLDGPFSLQNLDPCVCHDCNARKSNMTQAGFISLLAFAREHLSAYDRGRLMERLLEADAGSSARFWRNKAQAQAKPTAPKLPPPARTPDFFF